MVLCVKGIAKLERDFTPPPSRLWWHQHCAPRVRSSLAHSQPWGWGRGAGFQAWREGCIQREHCKACLGPEERRLQASLRPAEHLSPFPSCWSQSATGLWPPGYGIVIPSWLPRHRGLWVNLGPKTFFKKKQKQKANISGLPKAQLLKS